MFVFEGFFYFFFAFSFVRLSDFVSCTIAKVGERKIFELLFQLQTYLFKVPCGFFMS